MVIRTRQLTSLRWLQKLPATEIIAEKPEGLQSEIAQGGANVSGGQKQRLSIARALVKKAPIYIFDDSFSALDFKTDAALRAALKARTGSSTVLIVTQRIATIMNSDQIIVLDEGHIVGIGTHRELMESCEVYRDIALSQLSKEELA
jgi:ATP-binding cassette subfamily B protein